MAEKTAVIIGAGPAGLTAALELLRRTDIRPIVIEATDMLGGISRTVRHRGNRMDIGGHRFFSKADRIMDWWLDILPLQRTEEHTQITYHQRSRELTSTQGPDPETTDKVMLVRPRRSRIYYDRKFFDYPISLSVDTLAKLGVFRSFGIGMSYLRRAAFPRKPEDNLEDFFINRFGDRLYETFFRDYTEKVWGVPCRNISAEWGAQRVKGLSIAKAITHFVLRTLGSATDFRQKSVETSLIERFLYPKFGPGQMWEEVARQVEERGGKVLMRHRANQLIVDGSRVRSVVVGDEDARTTEIPADYVFSSMPVRTLVRSLTEPAPESVRMVSEGLQYRDFITVGLLLDELRVRDPDGERIRDNWIYIQEPDVMVGRMQIFNNWSPWMVADQSKTWIGLEYFCYSTDPIWGWSDSQMIEFAIGEMARIGLAAPAALHDGVVIRVPKTYPAYFGTYDRFEEVRTWLDRFENLYPVGRNGMHRYNNQDHSMLTAMTAVDNIIAGRTDHTNIWEINTEEEYHEEKK